MIFDICLGAAVFACLVAIIELKVKYDKILGRIGAMAMHVKELDESIEKLDACTGQSIYQVKKELDQFKADYGEAAIEEMREAAKSEKAWRDGVQNIMTFGNQFQGRGDNK